MRSISIGTKSVLFGVHQFVIHPLSVAAAWWYLYGFPWDPRLWLAFIVHDLGYIGKPNMDGDEGEEHVHFGAKFMGRLFGQEWYDFCLYHSRFWAKRAGVRPSRLCIADKFSFVMEPRWLYLSRACWSGEIKEYQAAAAYRTAMGEPSFRGGKYSTMNVAGRDEYEWHAGVRRYLLRWTAKHRHDVDDTWTPLIERKEKEQYSREL